MARQKRHGGVCSIEGPAPPVISRRLKLPPIGVEEASEPLLGTPFAKVAAAFTGKEENERCNAGK
jgi:hypothetical protein